MLKELIALFLLPLVYGEDPVIEINDGSLRGSVLKDMNGDDFFGFQKLPFAEAPLGELRFKDPNPPRKWIGIRDATKEGPMCLQIDALGEFTGEEDCLFLNVYSPDLTPEILKPVLVFIHGGGFAQGTGGQSSYGPQFLVTQDIVLVTLNYRLGVLGFTSFENPAVGVPGNAALKDQTAALRWVRDNIEHFGGDPQRVTISGESAGATSVHLHVLSPLSRGLFQRAIMQSGNAFVPYCNGDPNNGVVTAKGLGFEGTDEVEMLLFLQNATLEQLELASMNVTILAPLDVPTMFGPSIEPYSEDAFLRNTPRNILKTGNFDRDVQLMIGLTSAEGMLADIISILTAGSHTPWPAEKFIPYFFNLNSDQEEELMQDIYTFYNYQDTDNPEGHIALQTDAPVTVPTYETIFGHLLFGQEVYFYLFSSDSELNVMKHSNPITTNYDGVCHSDDLWYLFSSISVTPPSANVPGSVEYKAIQNTIRLFANFVKYGTPTLPEDDVQWERLVGNDSIKAFNIDLDQNHAEVEVFKDRAVFWCNVYKRYNQEHFCDWSSL